MRGIVCMDRAVDIRADAVEESAGEAGEKARHTGATHDGSGGRCGGVAADEQLGCVPTLAEHLHAMRDAPVGAVVGSG